MLLHKSFLIPYCPGGVRQTDFGNATIVFLSGVDFEGVEGRKCGWFAVVVLGFVVVGLPLGGRSREMLLRCVVNDCLAECLNLGGDGGCRC